MRDYASVIYSILIKREVSHIRSCFHLLYSGQVAKLNWYKVSTPPMGQFPHSAERWQSQGGSALHIVTIHLRLVHMHIQSGFIGNAFLHSWVCIYWVVSQSAIVSIRVIIIIMQSGVVTWLGSIIISLPCGLVILSFELVIQTSYHHIVQIQFWLNN